MTAPGHPRAWRWGAFLLSLLSLLYFLFIDARSLWAVLLFFVSGGVWYVLERRKIHALDGFRFRRQLGPKDLPE